MRVLHTADWHLGQRFQHGLDRLAEHRCFLDWLLTTIETERVDVLVVAGDVFDTGYPPAAALELYYSFLVQLRTSATCHDIVIVGGNHDAPATLNAPAALLKTLRVHVVGGVPARVQDLCLTLPAGAAKPRLVVAAVPFLRDADVRRTVAGESTDERETRLRAGIADYYRSVAACVSTWRARGVPVLATGHLFAAGGQASDTERLIHVGSLGQITADAFPPEFDYVALGHLHRPQRVGGTEHIRYSGSPIPLSFSEAAFRQQVVLLTFGDKPGCPTIDVLDVPCTRRLVRVSGSLAEVTAGLLAYDNTGHEHPAWADVLVEDAETTARVHELLDSLKPELTTRDLLIVSRRHQQPGAADALGEEVAEAAVPHLDDLRPTDVFDRFLDATGHEVDSPARQRLEHTFQELLTRIAA